MTTPHHDHQKRAATRLAAARCERVLASLDVVPNYTKDGYALRPSFSPCGGGGTWVAAAAVESLPRHALVLSFVT